MAAPTDPTLDSLTIEALKLSGAPTVTSGTTLQLLSEAWVEHLKNDIWSKSRKRLKSLQTTSVRVITDGARLVSCPTDFSSHLNMSLLQATHYGVCQAHPDGATAGQIKAAATEDAGSEVIGKEIIVYLTATKTTTYTGYITAINTTTKVITADPAWSIFPGGTYSYMIVDQETAIVEDHINNMSSVVRGTPTRYYPEGDSDYDQYYLDPVPYRTDSKPWAIREKYYANLMTVNLTEGATTLITKLYREWRAALIEGVMWKAYDYRDDDRALTANRKWVAARDQLISIETYGNDLSNLTCTVGD